MSQGAKEGGVTISRDGKAANCSRHKLHFPHPCGSLSQGAKEGGVTITRDGKAVVRCNKKLVIIGVAIA